MGCISVDIMETQYHILMRRKKLLAVIFFAVFITACTENSKPGQTVGDEISQYSDSVFINQIVAFDTLMINDKLDMVESMVERLKNVKGIESNPYYQYYLSFLERRKGNQAKADSIVKNMITEGRSEAEVYKKYMLFERQTEEGVVSAATIDQITAELKKAEKQHSKFAYLYNDVLAKSYYQNRMIDKSAFYTERYFTNSPYKNHPKVQQRFQDISFLLAAQQGDFEKMKKSNFEARRLALQLHDTVKYERTIDNEGQIYARMGDMPKALEKSREFAKLQERRKENLRYCYNNLGKAFLLNKMPDSALFYFKKANEDMYKDPPEKHTNLYWDGIKDSYAMMGDWKNAFVALDSSRHVEHRATQLADAKKIEEIHEKYESEKKDANIQLLQHQNLKKEKTINQQKWILFSLFLAALGAIGILYSRYKNKLLREKNALLKEENQRLDTDRKMLQVQLNPHFVFNAIANLQGLISSGEKTLAAKYLSGFSKILRDTLEQSRKDFITVEEEINTLRNYLELQQMRFPDLFDYEIAADHNVNTEDTLIPPMIIQPFIENSIEHGFRNINYKGLIKLTFEATDKQLIINIEDNGNGIKEKTGLQSDKKSLSRVILKERLEALFGNYEIPGSFVTVDKILDGEKGFNVKVEIPKITD